MSSKAAQTKGKTSVLVVVLYVIAAILAGVFCWMLYASIQYINSYMASYGMSFADMASDSVQYVMSQSLNYLIYALIIFVLAKGLKLLQNGRAFAAAESETAQTKTQKAGAEGLTAIADNDIPESEDAVEETIVIEDDGASAESARGKVPELFI